MLTIDRLRLQLPGEYGDRAHLIARMVANELAKVMVRDSRKIGRVSLPLIAVVPGTSDQKIASQIAAAVQTRLNGQGRSAL